MPELKDLNNAQLDTLETMFDRGFKEGNKHSSPSPETLQRLEKIEQAIHEITTTFLKHSETRDEHLQIMLTEFREGMTDVKRVTNLLNNSSFMVKLFIGLGSFFMFMGGAYLMVKSIINGNN